MAASIAVCAAELLPGPAGGSSAAGGAGAGWGAGAGRGGGGGRAGPAAPPRGRRGRRGLGSRRGPRRGRAPGGLGGTHEGTQLLARRRQLGLEPALLGGDIRRLSAGGDLGGLGPLESGSRLDLELVGLGQRGP